MAAMMHGTTDRPARSRRSFHPIPVRERPIQLAAFIRIVRAVAAHGFATVARRALLGAGIDDAEAGTAAQQADDQQDRKAFHFIFLHCLRRRVRRSPTGAIVKVSRSRGGAPSGVSTRSIVKFLASM